MKLSDVKEVYRTMNNRLKSTYGKVGKLDVKECVLWIQLLEEIDLSNNEYEIEDLVNEYIDLQPEYEIEFLEEPEYAESQDHMNLNGMSWRDFI